MCSRHPCRCSSAAEAVACDPLLDGRSGDCSSATRIKAGAALAEKPRAAPITRSALRHRHRCAERTVVRWHVAKPARCAALPPLDPRMSRVPGCLLSGLLARGLGRRLFQWAERRVRTSGASGTRSGRCRRASCSAGGPALSPRGASGAPVAGGPQRAPAPRGESRSRRASGAVGIRGGCRAARRARGRRRSGGSPAARVAVRQRAAAALR